MKKIPKKDVNMIATDLLREAISMMEHGDVISDGVMFYLDQQGLPDSQFTGLASKVEACMKRKIKHPC